VGKKLNLMGQRFGKLVVIESAGSHNRKTWWKCKCDCGNEKIVDTGSLRSGNTKSCGCMRYDGLKKYNLAQSEANKIPIGTRFGKLVVIEDIGFKTHVKGHKRRFYRCQCDCGNICEASGNQLKGNNKKSCGTCEGSIGELNIQQLLKDNHITFDYDKPLQDFINATGRRLRFDFILYDENKNISRIIEFDGRQHVTGPDTNYWGHSTDTLKQIQEKDRLKDFYCFDNNIPIVRIPYWKRDTLTIEDLLGDKFLIHDGRR
jgi:hypothetical protein